MKYKKNIFKLQRKNISMKETVKRKKRKEHLFEDKEYV